jgi:magnesium-transporting ATPase (P-type)
MNTEQNQVPQDTEKLKDIQKWTQRYAENRTLPFLVNMLAFLLLFCSSGGLFYVAVKAYRAGNMLLFWIGIFAVVLMFAVVILAVSFIERLLYRKEGQVTHAIPAKTKKERIAGWIAGLLFGACVIISIILIVLFKIPIKYMQPVSAICFIPLLIAIGIWRPPSLKPAGFLVWLWPILYVIHAILIVAGVPIVFGKPWTALNMLIPMAGYGILCALLGHIYSRYALKKLKKAAHLQDNTNEQQTK